MKTSRILPVVILTTITAATFTFASPLARLFQSDVSGQKFYWRTDLKSAHEESLLKNQPMLIFISGNQCDHCTRMKNSTLSDPRTIQLLNDKFIPVHLNIDDNKTIARILEVERIPCTVALTPRADLLGRITGYVSTSQYLDALGKVRRLNDKIARKPSSPAG